MQLLSLIYSHFVCMRLLHVFRPWKIGQFISGQINLIFDTLSLFFFKINIHLIYRIFIRKHIKWLLPNYAYNCHSMNNQFSNNPNNNNCWVVNIVQLIGQYLHSYSLLIIGTNKWKVQKDLLLWLKRKRERLMKMEDHLSSHNLTSSLSSSVGASLVLLLQVLHRMLRQASSSSFHNFMFY